MSILITLALAAAVQSVSSDKLPPANPLPPPASAEGQAMVPVSALLAAITARDATAIAATLRPDAAASIVASLDAGPGRVVRLGHDALVAALKEGTGRVEQRLYDPAIEVDGDIAFVWGRYISYVDGKPHHCGYDHFDLIRENGGWKIQNITWSSRTTGCDAAG